LHFEKLDLCPDHFLDNKDGITINDDELANENESGPLTISRSTEPDFFFKTTGK
jgi:hypothetical protein